MNRMNEAPILTYSVRVYRILLVAYPTRFRQEYGPHMLQVFRDCCLQSFNQNGTDGLIRLWGITLFDFFRSVLEQHLQKETYMSKEKFIKLSPWAFILGALTFLTLLGASDQITFSGSILGSILLAIGMLGIRARYSEKISGFGKRILLIGVLITAIFGLALVLGVVVNSFFLALDTSGVVSAMNNGAWIWLFGGPAILLLTLTLFGLDALSSKPMKRFNWLPLFTSIWYPALFIYYAIYIYTHNGANPYQFYTVFTLMLVVQFVTLAALGSVLISEKSKEIPVARFEPSVGEGGVTGK